MIFQKIKIIIFLIPLVLFVFFILFLSRKQPVQQINLGPIVTPKISARFLEKFSIKPGWDSTQISIPSSLPIYFLQGTSLSELQVIQIANNLGVNGSPVKLKEIYIWSSPSVYLTINPSLYEIDYKLLSEEGVLNSRPLFISEQEIKSKAENFIKEKKLVPSNLIINFEKIVYLNTATESYVTTSRKEDADTADVKFSIKVGNIPIISNQPEVGNISVQTDKSGKIFFVYMDLIGEFTEGPWKDLKSLDEIASSLSQATLQSLDRGNINPWQVSDLGISEISVKNISVAYLQEQERGQRILQPIFILTGEAKVRTNQTVEAILYLPALKN